MVSSLDIAIELSELFEATGYEGTVVSEIFDKEIIPMLKTPLSETDMVGLSDRIAKAIERVRMSLGRQGGDRWRTLLDMMKSALMTYVRNSHDAITGREIFHRAMKAGTETMLTVTGATILANALSRQHADQAKALLRGVAAKLSGPQPVPENASCAATSAGAVATVANGAKKKKQEMRRRDSIFAEDALNWSDLQGNPDTIAIMEDIVRENQERRYTGVMIDPVSAELVIAVHNSLSREKQAQYESRSVKDMIDIAFRAVQRGLIEVRFE